MTFPGRLFAPQPSAATLYLAGSVVLAVAAVVLAVVWKLNRYLLLLLAAMLWPYAIQLAFVSTGGTTDLLGNPTPLHLVRALPAARAVRLRGPGHRVSAAPVPAAALLTGRGRGRVR